MLEQMINKKFEYKKLTEQEQKARGILGRLVGPIADTKNPTRNGRKYSEQLWENVFENPIMQEKIKNRCCFGELNHPADRTDIDIEKVAICLAEQPKKGPDGKLYGVFDILSTPNGKILKALCDYGCNIGISSRGQGDLINDENGDEAVDADTYECEGFDAVLVPGVEAARLKYVNENLNTKNKTLNQVLLESLKNANESDRKIMENTLDSLNIKISESEETKQDEEKEIEKQDENIKEEENNKEEVNNKEEEENKEEEKNNDIEEEPSNEETINVDSSKEEKPLEQTEEEKTEEEKPEEDEKEDEKDETQKDDDLNIDLDSELFDDENSENKEDNIKNQEDIFLNYLENNFTEDQIKKVCKILDIEIEENENIEEPENEATKESDEADNAEAEDKEVSAEEVNSEEDKNISDKEEANEEPAEKVEEATDGRDFALVNSLKEALKVKSDLENNIKSLQEKLAVSDAKVDEITEECSRYKNAIARLSVLAKSNKDLNDNVTKLEESLNEKDEMIKTQKMRISRLVKTRKESVDASSSITESLNTKTNEIKVLKENFEKTKTDYETKINQLNESLTNSSKKLQELTESVTKATTLKENYKKLANNAVNKYIEIKADILGLTPADIKRKLGESYTLTDIDQVYNDLRAYQLNVSKLPFSIDKKIGVKVNESKQNLMGTIKQPIYENDDVDNGLMRLADLD